MVEKIFKYKQGVIIITSIDMKSKTPIYIQLKTAIIASILKEELKAGDTLPSVRKLSSDLGINLHTVNKTYNILRDEGFVAIHRSKGAVVLGRARANQDTIDELKKLLTPFVVDAKGKNIERWLFDTIVDSIWQEAAPEKYRESV